MLHWIERRMLLLILSTPFIILELSEVRGFDVVIVSQSCPRMLDQLKPFSSWVLVHVSDYYSQWTVHFIFWMFDAVMAIMSGSISTQFSTAVIG